MKHIFVTLLLSFAAINTMADNTVPVSRIEYEKKRFWPDEPEIVIPFDEAKPFLTDEALRLIK